MKKTLEPYQLIERSIIKKYRKELWTPFIVAVKRYELVQAGDRIAVCISGGKDSMLMAKLMQELQRHSDVPFELVFLVMDPGCLLYTSAGRLCAGLCRHPDEGERGHSGAQPCHLQCDPAVIPIEPAAAPAGMDHPAGAAVRWGYFFS